MFLTDRVNKKRAYNFIIKYFPHLVSTLILVKIKYIARLGNKFTATVSFGKSKITNYIRGVHYSPELAIVECLEQIFKNTKPQVYQGYSYMVSTTPINTFIDAFDGIKTDDFMLVNLHGGNAGSNLVVPGIPHIDPFVQRNRDNYPVPDRFKPMVDLCYNSVEKQYCTEDKIIENLQLPLKEKEMDYEEEERKFLMMLKQKSIEQPPTQEEMNIAACFVRCVQDTPLEGVKIAVDDESIHKQTFMKSTALSTEYFKQFHHSDKKDASTVTAELLITLRDLIAEKMLKDPTIKNYSQVLPPNIKTVFIKNEIKNMKVINGIPTPKLPRSIINDSVIMFCICYLLFNEILENSKKTQMDSNGIGVSNFHGGPEQIFRTMFKKTNLKMFEKETENFTKEQLAELFDWFAADVVEWDKSVTKHDMLSVVFKMFLKIDWKYLLQAGINQACFVYTLFCYFATWYVGNLLSVTKDKNCPLLLFLGTMPSGTYLTAYGNSEINNMKATRVEFLIDYIYYSKFLNFDIKLGSALMWVTYGDDLIMALLKSIREILQLNDEQFGIIVKYAYRMKFKDDFKSKKYFTKLDKNDEPLSLECNFLKNYFILEGDSIFTYRDHKDIIPKIYKNAHNVGSTVQECVRLIGLAWSAGRNKVAYDLIKGLFDKNKPRLQTIVDERTLNQQKIGFKIAGVRADILNKQLMFPAHSYILSKQVCDWSTKSMIDMNDERYIENHLIC